MSDLRRARGRRTSTATAPIASAARKWTRGRARARGQGDGSLQERRDYLRRARAADFRPRLAHPPFSPSRRPPNATGGGYADDSPARYSSRAAPSARTHPLIPRPLRERLTASCAFVSRPARASGGFAGCDSRLALAAYQSGAWIRGLSQISRNSAFGKRRGGTRAALVARFSLFSLKIALAIFLILI